MRVVPTGNGIDTATQSGGCLRLAFAPSFFKTPAGQETVKTPRTKFGSIHQLKPIDMKKMSFRVVAILTMDDGKKELCSFVQTNTSMVGAIKEVKRVAERDGVRKVRIIRCLDLEF